MSKKLTGKNSWFLLMRPHPPSCSLNQTHAEERQWVEQRRQCVVVRENENHHHARLVSFLGTDAAIEEFCKYLLWGFCFVGKYSVSQCLKNKGLIWERKKPHRDPLCLFILPKASASQALNLDLHFGPRQGSLKAFDWLQREAGSRDWRRWAC